MSGFDRLDEIANDPEKLARYKAETLERAMRENPNLTRESLEDQWTHLVVPLFF